MDGWICLHRKIRKNPIFNDMALLRLWLICLTEASHSERNQLIGRQSVRLLPGQFITGRFALHGMYNNGLKGDDAKSEKTVWRWLELLEKSEFLTINSTTKYSVITVENWDIYQDNKPDNDQQVTSKRPTDDQQVTNKRPTDDQQVTTNNNVNNDNNENNEERKRSRQRPAYAEDSSPFKMAQYFLNSIKSWTDKIEQPNLQQWADDCRLLLERDKKDKELIRKVIDWTSKNQFWRKNILCPAKLRKQFNRLVIEMESDSNSKLVYIHGGDSNERFEGAGGGASGNAEQDLNRFVRR
ncbi:hypothetical protein [Paenibacillus sp. 2TAB19]|uniref:hypothetical protein n=1 Tax=Paenibacillus sp. 2TAB19 TaxID=3233003 RepID=UPI003F96C56E